MFVDRTYLRSFFDLFLFVIFAIEYISYRITCSGVYASSKALLILVFHNLMIYDYAELISYLLIMIYFLLLVTAFPFFFI